VGLLHMNSLAARHPHCKDHEEMYVKCTLTFIAGLMNSQEDHTTKATALGEPTIGNNYEQ